MDSWEFLRPVFRGISVDLAVIARRCKVSHLNYLDGVKETINLLKGDGLENLEETPILKKLPDFLKFFEEMQEYVNENTEYVCNFFSKKGVTVEPPDIHYKDAYVLHEKRDIRFSKKGKRVYYREGNSIEVVEFDRFLTADILYFLYSQANSHNLALYHANPKIKQVLDNSGSFANAKRDLRKVSEKLPIPLIEEKGASMRLNHALLHKGVYS